MSSGVFDKPTLWALFMGAMNQLGSLLYYYPLMWGKARKCLLPSIVPISCFLCFHLHMHIYSKTREVKHVYPCCG
jgi:hypothetical protein